MTIYFYVLITLESLSENFAHSSKFRPAGDGVHDVELLAADDDDVDTARGRLLLGRTLNGSFVTTCEIPWDLLRLTRNESCLAGTAVVLRRELGFSNFL